MKKAEQLVVIKTMIADKKTDKEILDHAKAEKWRGNTENYIKEAKKPEKPETKVEEVKEVKEVDNGTPTKPKRKKLTISKVTRNMKGGATLSFEEKHDDIVVPKSIYKKGDTYLATVKVKSKKK